MQKDSCCASWLPASASTMSGAPPPHRYASRLTCTSWSLLETREFHHKDTKARRRETNEKSERDPRISLKLLESALPPRLRCRCGESFSSVHSAAHLQCVGIDAEAANGSFPHLVRRRIEDQLL